LINKEQRVHIRVSLNSLQLHENMNGEPGGVADVQLVSIRVRQAAADPNVPGFLLTLSGRRIIPPADPDLWPARECLAEHRKEWGL
jgi:hypothetical protein